MERGLKPNLLQTSGLSFGLNCVLAKHFLLLQAYNLSIRECRCCLFDAFTSE